MKITTNEKVRPVKLFALRWISVDVPVSLASGVLVYRNWLGVRTVWELSLWSIWLLILLYIAARSYRWKGIPLELWHDALRKGEIFDIINDPLIPTNFATVYKEEVLTDYTTTFWCYPLIKSRWHRVNKLQAAVVGALVKIKLIK